MNKCFHNNLHFLKIDFLVLTTTKLYSGKWRIAS
jgi:hypothetical protein